MREHIVLTRVAGQNAQQDHWSRGHKLEREGYFLLSTQSIRKGHGIRGEGPDIFVHTYARDQPTLREVIRGMLTCCIAVHYGDKTWEAIREAYDREIPDGEES